MAGQAATSGPILLAHRGAGRVAPENSLEAFEAALRAGADGIETDWMEFLDGQTVRIGIASGGLQLVMPATRPAPSAGSGVRGPTGPRTPIALPGSLA